MSIFIMADDHGYQAMLSACPLLVNFQHPFPQHIHFGLNTQSGR